MARLQSMLQKFEGFFSTAGWRGAFRSDWSGARL
jgi:hypothetical protein